MRKIQDYSLGCPALKLLFQVISKLNIEGNDSLQKIVELTGLKEREVRVLLMRFKSHEEVNMIYEDIAKNIGLRSRERVRQIKEKALRKIRKEKRITPLLDYLEIKRDYSDWISDNYSCE